MNFENQTEVYDTRMVQIVRMENGHLYIDIDALWTILDKVGDYPMSIISVDGPLQDGKSRIVSSLLSYLTTYKDIAEESLYQNYMPEVLWKTVSERPNQILMWPEPLMGNYNCENTAILLMSIHGNMDNTIPSMESALISAFGWLLSSVTIYHVKEDFSEEMLQFLHMIMACSMEVSRQENFSPFAKLMFAVNDYKYPGNFQYGIHDDQGGPVRRNFKKEKLDILTGLMPERRFVREEILARFGEIGCCLMPPFSDNIEEVNDLKLHKKLVNWILTGPRTTKTFQGKDVTSTMLKGLVLEWNVSLNMSKLPAFKTIIEAPTEVLIASSLSVAIKYFKKEMAREMRGQPFSEHHFQIKLNYKRVESMVMFERLTTIIKQSVLKKYAGMLDGEHNEFHRLTMLHVVNTRIPSPPLVHHYDNHNDHHHHRRRVPGRPGRFAFITRFLGDNQWRCCSIVTTCIFIEMALLWIVSVYLVNRIFTPVSKY